MGLSFQVTDVIDRSSDLWRELYALPKIELHRHLEGSIRLETLCEVGIAYNIELPAYEPETLRPYVQMTAQDKPDLLTFLEKFGILRRFYADEAVIRRIVAEAVEDAAADNIRYMELRFTPNALAKMRGYAFEDVVGWVSEVAIEEGRKHRVKVNLIASMNRHEGLDIAEKTLNAALAYQGNCVTGLDLAGKEPGFPSQPFSPYFRKAKQAGLGVTIHAGEWVGPENVRDAIQIMKADRIGHGVRIVEDSETAQIARDYGVVFEVCPTSNVQTGVVGLLQHHPLIDMLYLDLPITLNTDDPTVHPTTLTDEYALAVQGIGLGLRHVHEMIFQAAQAAFMPNDEKTELLNSLRKELGRSRYRGIQA